MKQPKISVIVPVYNVEKYLRRCVDSILAQTFSDFELLLIDDGSTDNSVEICDEYAQKCQKVQVWHLLNGGPSSARNFGIDKAVGDYVYFVDSDDWIEPSSLSDFLGNETTEYDVYFQSFVQHNLDGSVTKEKLLERTAVEEDVKEVLSYLITNSKFGWTWIKILKRSILCEYNIRFDEQCSLQEDELLTLQYCQHIKSLVIRNNANYHYYIYNSSLTRKKRLPMEHIATLRNLCTEARKYEYRRILIFYQSLYLGCLHNSLLYGYKYSVIPFKNKAYRLNLISEFLKTYNELPKSIIQYKCIPGVFYKILWAMPSLAAIDCGLRLKFKSKF